MAGKKGVTKAKAKKILREGRAKGKPLTRKQRKFFGARAAGLPVKTKPKVKRKGKKGKRK